MSTIIDKLDNALSITISVTPVCFCSSIGVASILAYWQSIQSKRHTLTYKSSTHLLSTLFYNSQLISDQFWPAAIRKCEPLASSYRPIGSCIRCFWAQMPNPPKPSDPAFRLQEPLVCKITTETEVTAIC